MRRPPIALPSVISSPSNPTVKELRQLHERRGRRRQRAFLAEGVRLVETALNSDAVPNTVLIAPKLLRATPRGRALDERLRHAPNLPAPLDVTPPVLRHVADTETPSGVLAALPLPPDVTLADVPAAGGLTIVLDGVQDPGNAGTILRTAAAAGADAVVALAGCVDLFAPKVVRAGMGAHFHLTLAVDVAPAEAAAWLNAQHRTALLADARAPQSVYAVDLREPIVLVVGSEARGAARLGALPGLRRVAIPMPGTAESLNAAVAAAITIFEAVRQRTTAR